MAILRLNGIFFLISERAWGTANQYRSQQHGTGICPDRIQYSGRGQGTRLGVVFIRS